MSLFDAPNDCWIAHSCNIEGIWGSGVAAQLKVVSPLAFERYKNSCDRDYPGLLLGSFSASYFDDLFNIANLFVSSIDSRSPDLPEEILMNTTTSLYAFFKYIQFHNTDVYIPKLNSGVFNVPWEKTEKIVRTLSDRYNINVIVCDPNLEE